MNCFLRYIGVVDTRDKLHHVNFERGLNIITGASSTGKSAILEIFDFCLGSSEDTVPVGRITERAQAYFIAFEFPGYMLVTARTASDKKCFLSVWHGCSHTELLDTIARSPDAFTEKRREFPHADFKKELGRHFSITFKNVDVEPWRQFVPRAKSPTPSVRTFASFMLQHQNLVANKHAIFYRFDEKEKRDQAIEHFKILMGLVKEEYYDQAKQLEQTRLDLKKIENQIPREVKKKDAIVANYDRLLSLYNALAGRPLVDSLGSEIYLSPRQYMDYLSEHSVQINMLSNKVETERQKLLDLAAPILNDKRKAGRLLTQVKQSIKTAENFSIGIQGMQIPKSTELTHTHCLLCESATALPAVEASKLIEAIDWLNDELKLSTYAIESFADQERQLIKNIAGYDAELEPIQKSILHLDEELKRLSASKSVNEQAIAVKVELELALRDQLAKRVVDLSEQEKTLRAEVKRLQELVNAHGVETKLKSLNDAINDTLCRFGDRFDFESTYKPSRLRFDLQTFELWYQMDESTRVYLRSMGSGANWLYSHLALFMSLHYQFAAYHKHGCKIPPILFLDQPTQVYFPALDKDDTFDSNAASGRADRVKKKDSDLLAVNSMFTELARFCDETEMETGVRPQIIVSDHADNLALGEPYEFSSFVRRTWRERGFIANEEEVVV
ncbi:DUF3732 domain-containing protein [Pseudomonas syringae]